MDGRCYSGGNRWNRNKPRQGGHPRPPNSRHGAPGQDNYSRHGTPRPGNNSSAPDPSEPELQTNLFELTTNLPFIYHYDVTIENLQSNVQKESSTSNKKRPLGLKFQRILFEQAIENWSLFQGVHPAFDGNKNCYTSRELSIVGEKACLDYKYETQTYSLTVQPVKKYNGSCKVDLSHLLHETDETNVPQEIITALVVILRHCPSLHSFPVGQGFYKRPENPFCLEDKLEIWPGYNFSIISGQDQLFLNFDNAFKLFYPSCNLKDFKQFTILKHAKVFTTYLGYKKKHTIKGFGLSADQQTFQMEGRTVSISEYFRSKYPRIWLTRPNDLVVNVGTNKFPVHIPLELCTLFPDQTFDQTLSTRQQAAFNREALLPPHRKFRLIHESLAEFVAINKTMLQEFQITIDQRPVCLKASLLKPPTLLYKNGEVNPCRGTWKSQPFYRPATLDKWIVFSYNREAVFKPKLEQFLKFLQTNATQNGVKTAPPKIVYLRNFQGEELRHYFEQDYKIALVALNSKSNTKGLIKTIGDRCNIATTCITDVNIIQKGTNPGFVNSIVQNINMKLHGANWILSPETCPDLLKDPHILVMGADVNHAAAFSSDPSIAAISCNMDAYLNCYKGVTREQASRCEIIQDLKPMVAECLKEYAQENPHSVPTKLLFFRDGVGEGQYEALQEQEIPHVMEAFSEVFPYCGLPKLTFVVVLKRHHMRLSQDQGRSNVFAGTALVHTKATRTREFLLCSHAGIQGTSVPIKYKVLHDDNGLGDEEVCQVAYCLCHLNLGCTRTIATPAVVHDAHRLALRGKEYFLADCEEELVSSYPW